MTEKLNINFFNKILSKLLTIEGGYSFYKEDNGGETYKGIARNFYSNWEGWNIIDKYKKQINFDEQYQTYIKNKINLKKLFNQLNNFLYKDNDLNDLVKKFYYDKYWAPAKLDQIAKKYPELAEKIFTLSVNTGTYKTGIKFLQKAMNYLNVNGKEFPDLIEDGEIGLKTLNAFKHLVDTGFKADILVVIKLLQGKHYLNLMDKNPEYKKFRGWFRRVQCE